MSTAQEMINSSLRLIRVLAAGETPDASMSNDALQVLNDMLEEWTITKYLTPQYLTESFDLVSGQASYTIGTTGDFSTTRPVRIESAYVRDGSNDYTLRIVDYDEYNRIVAKSNSTNLPTVLYYDTSYANGTIKLYPEPSDSTVDLFITSWKPFATATLTGEIALPPGYNKAIKYNLAIELGPEYGKTVDGVVFDQAEKSKSALKLLNSLGSGVDSIINTPFSGNGTRYDINSNTFRR